MDKYSDIISLKHFFKNYEYTMGQATKIWKKKHHDSVIDYHKKYNEEHNVKDKIAGYCSVCQVQTSNVSQHNKTRKHHKKLEKI